MHSKSPSFLLTISTELFVFLELLLILVYDEKGKMMPIMFLRQYVRQNTTKLFSNFTLSSSLAVVRGFEHSTLFCTHNASKYLFASARKDTIELKSKG